MKSVGSLSLLFVMNLDALSLVSNSYKVMATFVVVLPSNCLYTEVPAIL